MKTAYRSATIPWSLTGLGLSGSGITALWERVPSAAQEVCPSLRPPRTTTAANEISLCWTGDTCMQDSQQAFPLGMAISLTTRSFASRWQPEASRQFHCRRNSVYARATARFGDPERRRGTPRLRWNWHHEVKVPCLTDLEPPRVEILA